MFFHPPALGRVRQHRDQEGGLAAGVAPERHRQMPPELGTVFAPAALFDFERAALAPDQLAQQSFVGRNIAGINCAADFPMKPRMNSWKEIARMPAGQFLPAVAKHSAEGGIRFQNPAIELANPNPNHSPFKHRTKEQIGLVIASRLKVGDDVHTDTAPKNSRSQVSALRFQENKVLRPDS